MPHANTPALQVFDPRGLGVRGVAYHRRDSASVLESYVNQQVHDVAGRTVLSRDPRLFLLNTSAANQTNVLSLSGAVLLSDNSDAGWRLGLLGEQGQRLEGWDQKLSHSHVDYDHQCRPIAAFERSHEGAQHCTARFSYADAGAETDHNRCGQLIRHDDTAGSLHFTEFSLNGTALQHSRTFVADPRWPVDWPVAEAERDAFLESESAVTRIHCNAASEPISQIDALGNRQTFLQTRAAEMCEVRLTLAGQTDDKPLVSDIQHNAFGQIERQRAGNGVISSAIFRADDGRLEHLAAYVPGQPALQDLTYEYDAVGNITGISDAAEAIHFHRNQRIESTNHYRYDSLDRLIEASGRQIRNVPGGPQLPDFQSANDPGQLENYTRIYTYDQAGNLQTLQHQADSACRTERTALARLSNRSLPQKANDEPPDEYEIAAGYDLNGNRKYLQPGQDLQWDLRNQLRQVNQVVREDEPNDCEFYVYDGSGQRQRKIRQACTSTLTRAHETRYLTGVETRTSVDEILHVITVKAGRGTVQVLHWEKRKPSGVPQDQQRYSFTDHLNSSTLELDEAALLISRESYYPYGGTCWWAGRNKVEANYKTLRYSGQERDATGLYYYGFRYYVPWCQRWLNADPSGTADGFNLYAMVHGNPVGHIDIDGLVDDHAPASTQQLSNASTSAFTRDFISRGLGGVAQMSTVAALNTLPATRATNSALKIALGALGGTSVGLVGGGLSTRIDARAVAFGAVLGFTLGILPAALSSDGGDTEEVELNQDVIDLIGVLVGQIARETSQQTLRGHGSNFPWGNVSVRERMPTIIWSVLAYAIPSGLNGAFGQFLPEAMRSWTGPTVEGVDGAASTYLRGRHSRTQYNAGSSSLQTPPPVDTLFGVAGRITSAIYSHGIGLAIEAITQRITGLSAGERGMMATMLSGGGRGILLATTDFRGAIMQVAQDGYRQFNRQAAIRMSSDVQTTNATITDRPTQRRNSITRL
jgi:RHS repeat-associated protein